MIFIWCLSMKINVFKNGMFLTLPLLICLVVLQGCSSVDKSSQTTVWWNDGNVQDKAPVVFQDQKGGFSIDVEQYGDNVLSEPLYNYENNAYPVSDSEYYYSTVNSDGLYVNPYDVSYGEFASDGSVQIFDVDNNTDNFGAYDYQGYSDGMQTNMGGMAGITPMPSDYRSVYTDTEIRIADDAGKSGYTSCNNNDNKNIKDVSLFFAHDSADIDNNALGLLTGFVGDSDNMNKPIIVEGYASTVAATNDPKLREIVNLRKSLDRAYNVSSELIRNGIPAQNIKACGYGDNAPVPDINGMSNDAVSRRVDILTGY